MVPKLISSLAALLYMALAAPVQLGALDWPQWRGPDHDGISTENNWATNWPKEGPPQLWKASVGIGYSSISVADGKVYTMGNTDEIDSVFCFDGKTGEQLWKHSYACSAKDPNGYPGPRCTPTVHSNLVYTVSRQGHLFCLNARDGKVVWSKNFKDDYKSKVPTWGFSGSPLIEGERLIVEVGGRGAAAAAFEQQTGREIWKSGNDQPGYASPVAFPLGEKRQVAFFHATDLVGRNVSDGLEQWRFPWKTSYDVNAATPVVFGNRIFISSGYGRGAALIEVQPGSSKPKVVWQNKNMRNHMNPCVLLQEHLYGFDEGELKCLEFSTGKVKWSEKLYGKGSLMAANGILIIFSDTGLLALVAASPEAFTEIASAQVLGGRSTWVVPVLSGGRIYCRSGNTLACFTVEEKSKAGLTSLNVLPYVPIEN